MLFQEEIGTEVKSLLSLKADYKSTTGKDWKPGEHVPTAAQVTSTQNADELNQKITEQGNKIRDLKSKKAGKVGTCNCKFWAINRPTSSPVRQ